MDAQGSVNHILVHNNTDSASSVNFKHARRSGQEEPTSTQVDVQNNSGLIRNLKPIPNAKALFDYDPYLNMASSDTQEQSGHTPPDYNTVYPTASMEAPSPAREDSTEEEVTGPKDDAFDPAELEWLINNAPSKAVEAATNTHMDNEAVGFNIAHEHANAQLKVRSDVSDIVTPLKTSPDAPRRSARITNRSGPVETVERYKIAAMRKGLELQAEIGVSKNVMEIREREAGMLKDEDCERVAEGAGYIISPKNKTSVSSFIKGTSGLQA